jgi:hypothetical protein
MTDEEARRRFEKEFEVRKIAMQHWPERQVMDLIADMLVKVVIEERIRCKKLVAEAAEAIGRG